MKKILAIAIMIAIISVCSLIELSSRTPTYQISNVFDEIILTGKTEYGKFYTETAFSGYYFRFISDETALFFNAERVFQYVGNKKWTLSWEEKKDGMVYISVRNSDDLNNYILVEYIYSLSEKKLTKTVSIVKTDDRKEIPVKITYDAFCRSVSDPVYTLNKIYGDADGILFEMFDYWIEMNEGKSRFKYGQYGDYSTSALRFEYMDPETLEIQDMVIDQSGDEPSTEKLIDVSGVADHLN